MPPTADASHREWANRIEAARRRRLPGDILVLAEEAPTPRLQADATAIAGELLLALRQYDFALEQFDRALRLDPACVRAREARTRCLGLLGRYEEANAWLHHPGAFAFDRPASASPDGGGGACGDGASVAGLHTLGDATGDAPPSFTPHRVFLFSGHMIDAPDRPQPRFPADREDIAARTIAATLDALDAGPDDLALTQGANGGDLLFLEAGRARGLRPQLLLPLDEAAFIARSVQPAGPRWRERYLAIRAGMPAPPRVMPDELGPPPAHGGDGHADPFERCNLWLLYTALARGLASVRFVCLWNGAGGDGPGGTAHMYREIERRGGHVAWLDTRTLW